MSSRNMALNQIKVANKDFGSNHTVKVSGFNDGNGGPRKPKNRIPQWFKEFYDKDYKPFQQAFIESQSKPPKWFEDFYNNDYKPFQQAFIESQSKPPKWFEDFYNNDYKPFQQAFIESQTNHLNDLVTLLKSKENLINMF